MTKIEQELLNTNWPLLRKQKLWLLEQEPTSRQDSEFIDGLIGLLDAVQDAAVDDGLVTSQDVFG